MHLSPDVEVNLAPLFHPASLLLPSPLSQPLKHTYQPPSGASVESLTAHSTDSESTVHEEVELRTDRDVEDLSKQLEKER